MGEVPEIGQVAVHFDEVADLGVGKAVGAVFVQAHPVGDGQFALGFLAGVLDHLAQEAGAVFQAAAVFVGAVVGGAGQEVLEDAEAMRAVEADQVEPGGLGAAEGVAEPAAEVADVFAVQGAGLHRVGGEGQDRAAGDGQGHVAGVKVRAVDPGIGQLDARERPVGFHRLGHAGEGGDVLVLPQVLFDEGGDFGRGVDFGLFGEDHAPAAFGLRPAHFGHG